MVTLATGADKAENPAGCSGIGSNLTAAENGMTIGYSAANVVAPLSMAISP